MSGTSLELQLLEPLKPELTSFCCRMLASIEDQMNSFFQPREILIDRFFI